MLPLQMPSSSLMGGPISARMAASAGMMMPGSNPYGPSGPPPPSLSGTSFSAPSTGMSGPPGSRMPHSMYPSSGNVGPGASSGGSGSGPSMPGGGGGVGGGASHQSSHQPPPGVGGGPPTSKASSVLNTIQLQQLSAQLKAYKLLARNVSPPDALISIVHGRKPTAAMLAAVGKQQPHSQSSHPSSSSLGIPPQGDLQRGPGSGSGGAASEGGSGGNISLYPLSPNVSQGALPSSVAQSQAPIRSTSSLSQSLTSSSMSAGSGAAPNVTISSSGELPLSVKQAMSAVQSRSSSTPPMPSGQQSSTPPMKSISPAPTSSHGPTPPAAGTTGTTASGQSVPVGQSQQHPQSQQHQQQTAGSQQQQQQVKPQLKSIKLAPSGKPQGIDPTVIIKERENRYVLRRLRVVCLQVLCTYHCIAPPTTMRSRGGDLSVIYLRGFPEGWGL